jgi:hypothetical protein
MHGLWSARTEYEVQLHADQRVARLAACEPPWRAGREAAVGMALPRLLERL